MSDRFLEHFAAVHHQVLMQPELRSFNAEGQTGPPDLELQDVRLAAVGPGHGREEFTDALVNTLEQGADNLVLADMNEEGANLVTLQTRQALATQSLSISAAQSQQVLALLV